MTIELIFRQNKVTERMLPCGTPISCSQARVQIAAAGCRVRVYQFRCLVNRGTMSVNSLPKTNTRRDCNLNPSPSVPESSTLTARLHVRERVFEFVADYAHQNLITLVAFRQSYCKNLIWTFLRHGVGVQGQKLPSPFTLP